ncbi:MAG: ATP-binding protein [Pseudomonadota bacterium]
MTDHLNLLLVEDDASDAQAILDELETFGIKINRSMRVEAMPSIQEAFDNERWDAVICDYVLPGLNWQDVLTLCRQYDKDVPFVVVSGKRGIEYAVEVMRLGAQDYVTKQKLIRLAPALERELMLVHSRREALEREANLAAKLKQARRLESTGKLAGGLAHNLNNALSTILGSLELAQHKANSEEARLLIEHALKATVQATEVVRQLGNLTAEPEISPETFRLADRIEQIHEILRRVIPEEIDLTYVITPEDATEITTDPIALEQILINLILNARDAVEDQGYIKCGYTITGKTLIVSVTDNGAGIDEDHLDHIFEPYFTTKAEKGTGMGLASVDQLVRAMQGEIKVESTAGLGTSFDITFPLPDESSAVAIPQPTVAQATKPRRALVVHPNETLRFKIHSVLSALGFDVASHAELLEVDQSTRESPDVMLIDVGQVPANGLVESDRETQQSIYIGSTPKALEHVQQSVVLEETTPLQDLRERIRSAIVDFINQA